MNWFAAHEIAGLKQYARLIDSLRHLERVGSAEAQWLLDKQMLFRGSRLLNERLMAVRLRANDDGFDSRVRPDRVQIRYRRGLDRLGAFLRALRVVIPVEFNLRIRAVIYLLVKLWGVDWLAPDKRYLMH